MFGMDTMALSRALRKRRQQPQQPVNQMPESASTDLFKGFGQAMGTGPGKGSLGNRVLPQFQGGYGMGMTPEQSAISQRRKRFSDAFTV